MRTSKEDIRKWLQEGVKQGATHVVVACDTFDHEDFPVYVKPSESVRAIVEDYSSGERMLRVMEVYALHLDLESQLNETHETH